MAGVEPGLPSTPHEEARASPDAERRGVTSWNYDRNRLDRANRRTFKEDGGDRSRRRRPDADAGARCWCRSWRCSPAWSWAASSSLEPSGDRGLGGRTAQPVLAVRPREGVMEAYGALFAGALGNPAGVCRCAEQLALHRRDPAFDGRPSPFTESLVAPRPTSSPGWRWRWASAAACSTSASRASCSWAAIFAVWVGYTIKGLPAIIHLPLALLAGALGGALWGFIPGLLKAKVGAHEVINTIMMNYIAFRLSDWLLNGPMMRPGEPTPSARDRAVGRAAALLCRPPASPGLLPRAGRGGLRVVVPVPDHAGLRAAHGGRQPQRGALLPA